MKAAAIPAQPLACRWPWITFGLMLMLIVAYLLEILHTGGANGAVGRWGCNPSLASSGNHFPQSDLPAWLGLVTATFLHRSWLHLAGNLSVLAILGIGLERVLGHYRILLLYLLTGLLGIGGMVVTLHAWNIAACGASVVAAGVWAAWLVQPRSCLAGSLPFHTDAVGWRRLLQLLIIIIIMFKLVFNALGWFGYSMMTVFDGAGWRVFWSVRFCGHLYGALLGAMIACTLLPGLYRRSRVLRNCSYVHPGPGRE